MEKQREKILKAMSLEPDRIWFAKDFQHGEHFVWYEAGTRIGDLVRLGLVDKVGMQGKFMGYRLATEKPPVIHKPCVTVTTRTVIMKSPEEYRQSLIDAFIAGHDSYWGFGSTPITAAAYVDNLK